MVFQLDFLCYTNYIIKTIRLFFKGFYQVKLPAQLRQPKRGTKRLTTRQFNVNKEIFSPQSTETNGIKDIDDYISLHKHLKELKEKHGLDNIKKIIEIL